ncbi:MAG: nucleotide exchange factor GrpE [Jatrophihabitantaceae bacterium]
MTSSDEEPVVITDKRKIDRPDPDRAGSGPDTGPEPAQSAEPDLLAERTADLQRLQAEYTNYRRRTERDRQLAGEAAISRVLTALLPVLDNLDRARDHGDLTGGLKAVADQLDGVFGKLGLVAFGEVGDPFDPSVHEAVLHDESDAVDVATCTSVMRPGYKHNDRLLRAAMVGVSDPAAPAREPEPEPEERTEGSDPEAEQGVADNPPQGPGLAH